MEYKFYGQINFNEYHQYLKLLSGKLFIRKIVIIILLLIFISIIIFFTIIKDISRNNINQYTIEGVIWLLMGIISILLLLWILASLLRSKFRSKKMKKMIEKNEKKSFELNKKINEKFEYIINENNIIINSRKENILLNKNNIKKIMIDTDSVYIFHGKKGVYIIKKRFFDDEKMFNELVTFLKEKYNENIKKSNGHKSS